MWKEISHLPRHVQRGTDQMHHLCKLSENLDLDPASWKFLVNRKNRWPYSKFMSRIVVVTSKLNQSFPAPKKWKYTIADWIWHSFNEQFSNAFIQQLVSQPTGFFWQFKDLSDFIPTVILPEYHCSCAQLFSPCTRRIHATQWLTVSV